MAAFPLVAMYVALGGVDYSAYCAGSTLDVEAAELDTTNFASSGWMANIGGIKKATLNLTFNDDITSGAIDGIIWTAFTSASGIVTFEIRGTNASVGTSNPKWTGSVLVSKWQLGGNVGDLARKTLALPTTGAVTRATS